jgi:hypothetical protein
MPSLRTAISILWALAVAILVPLAANAAPNAPATGQADGFPVNTVVSCGVAFELSAKYRIGRPERADSKQGPAPHYQIGRPDYPENPSGGDECQFTVWIAKPKNSDLYECHTDGYASAPPYEVCDWYLAFGPVPLGAVGTVVVGHGRLNDMGQRDLGDFFSDEDGWHLPDAVSGSITRMDPAQLAGKSALKGEFVYKGEWNRGRTSRYEHVYGGTNAQQGSIVQLSPDLLVGIVGNPILSGDAWATRFRTSLRVAAPGDLRPRH